MFDDRCKLICRTKPNMLVPWFLMASYAYYELDRPILRNLATAPACKSAVTLYAARIAQLMDRGADMEVAAVLGATELDNETLSSVILGTCRT